jgi:hypothetical protein
LLEAVGVIYGRQQGQRNNQESTNVEREAEDSDMLIQCADDIVACMLEDLFTQCKWTKLAVRRGGGDLV